MGCRESGQSRAACEKPLASALWLQSEGRPPFADVSLTPWRELAMLTAPTAGQLENVPIAVPLQDYAVGFVAVQVQEQLQ